MANSIFFACETIGDEILSVNGQSLTDITHTDSLNLFKSIKNGDLTLQVARREVLRSRNHSAPQPHLQSISVSCEQLYKQM